MKYFLFVDKFLWADLKNEIRETGFEIKPVLGQLISIIIKHLENSIGLLSVNGGVNKMFLELDSLLNKSHFLLDLVYCTLHNL